MEKPINMECEICGKPVNKHNPIRAKIEGSVMVVCSDCAKLGKIQKAQSKPKFTQRKKNKPSTPSKTQCLRDQRPGPGGQPARAVRCYRFTIPHRSISLDKSW